MFPFVMPPNGWHNDPAAVQQVIATLERRPGHGPAIFGAAAPSLIDNQNDDPVFFWKAEELAFKKRLASWDQQQDGCCVSQGCGRSVQDSLVIDVAAGKAEWPGAEIATEPIYGGSRVQVGGGQLRGRDGSVGAWAAQWVHTYGVLPRFLYNEGGRQYDLRVYDQNRSKQWGDDGCPDALIPLAKIHPVTATALLQSADDLWAALGGGKPCSVASNQGFTMQRSEGYCQPSGTWGHQMCFRGRFIHPSKGKSFVLQNSWGDYLHGEDTIQYLLNGQIQTEQLPQGAFAVTYNVAQTMIAMQDSFAYAGVMGWAPTKLTWNPLG